MSICILSNDDLGSRSIMSQYLLHYLEESENRCCIILFEEKTEVFLADYICVKNRYFNLKINSLKYNKKKNWYSITPKDIILNNLSEGEVEEYERDANNVFQNTKIYGNLRNKNFDAITNIIKDNDNFTCIFVHGYIKYLANIGSIVEEGLLKMKELEAYIENDGKKLFFDSFIPSLDFRTREKLKKFCIKHFANVLLCIDIRLKVFTKEDYEKENYMTVTNKNDSLIAYRLKLDGKVKIE